MGPFHIDWGDESGYWSKPARPYWSELPFSTTWGWQGKGQESIGPPWVLAAPQEKCPLFSHRPCHSLLWWVFSRRGLVWESPLFLGPAWKLWWGRPWIGRNPRVDIRRALKYCLWQLGAGILMRKDKLFNFRWFWSLRRESDLRDKWFLFSVSLLPRSLWKILKPTLVITTA